MDKITNEIFNLMEYYEGQNNYDINELHIVLNEDYITVTGVYLNEYGGRYGNNDEQDIYYNELTQECIDYLFDMSDKLNDNYLILTM